MYGVCMPRRGARPAAATPRRLLRPPPAGATSCFFSLSTRRPPPGTRRRGAAPRLGRRAAPPPASRGSSTRTPRPASQQAAAGDRAAGCCCAAGGATYLSLTACAGVVVVITCCSRAHIHTWMLRLAYQCGGCSSLCILQPAPTANVPGSLLAAAAACGAPGPPRLLPTALGPVAFAACILRIVRSIHVRRRSSTIPPPASMRTSPLGGAAICVGRNEREKKSR